MRAHRSGQTRIINRGGGHTRQCRGGARQRPRWRRPSLESTRQAHPYCTTGPARHANISYAGARWQGNMFSRDDGMQDQTVMHDSVPSARRAASRMLSHPACGGEKSRCEGSTRGASEEGHRAPRSSAQSNPRTASPPLSLPRGAGVLRLVTSLSAGRQEHPSLPQLV